MDARARIVSAFNEETAAYALQLAEAGFTVYVPVKGSRVSDGWFHYSRTVDGRECYGTFSEGSQGFDGPSHTMPIRPSRLNGSSAHVGAKWGDPETLGMDAIDVMSVDYARIVARPSNYCPHNAEPTREAIEATERAYIGHRGTPQRFYRGATLQNARPWGIEEGHYVAANAD